MKHDSHERAEMRATHAINNVIDKRELSTLSALLKWERTKMRTRCDLKLEEIKIAMNTNFCIFKKFIENYGITMKTNRGIIDEFIVVVTLTMKNVENFTWLEHDSLIILSWNFIQKFNSTFRSKWSFVVPLCPYIIT